MIRATLYRNGKLAVRDFDDATAFGDFLDTEAKGGGDMLVRIPDDVALYEVESRCAKRQLEAQRASQMLAGASGSFWSSRDPMAGAMMLWPDAGGGWRMRLLGMTSRAQVPQGLGPPNGLRRPG